MLLHRSMDPGWLSNSWLLADTRGGVAILVDTGGPPEPLAARLQEWGCSLAAVLLTHFHPDHVAHTERWRAQAPVWGPRAEADLLPPLDRELSDGEQLRVGELEIHCLHTPGHTKGQMAYALPGYGVFTGDTLFAGSVGGTLAKGHTTYEDLRQSIMVKLLGLPGDLKVLPGHCGESTLGEERRSNPFVRFWSGDLPALGQPVRVGGRGATLLVEGRDYDGGSKCAVAWGDGGHDVVPGSRVLR